MQGACPTEYASIFSYHECIRYQALYSYLNANQKHLGCKKVRRQEEEALVRLHATKIFDITEGQEVWDMHSSPRYQLPHSCLCTGISQLQLALSLGHLLLCKGGQVTKPIVVVKFRCINMNEVTDTVVNYAYPKLLGLL